VLICVFFRIAHDFGISLPMLSSFPTHEEKHKYIVECLVKSVNDDLREFNKKHHQRQMHHANFEDDYKKYKEKIQTDNADIFSWLNVKTSYSLYRNNINNTFL